jgi:hypothetical protein
MFNFLRSLNIKQKHMGFPVRRTQRRWLGKWDGKQQSGKLS